MQNTKQDLTSIYSYSKQELEDDSRFEKELKLLGSQWNFVDHISNYEKVGDYRVHELLGESIIIVKSAEGFKGYLNFCTHRGSVICTKNQGNTKVFVCPYHSWAFGLDGRLRNAPACPSATAEPDKNALKSVAVEEIQGMLFVGLNQGAMVNFDDVKQALTPLFQWQGLERAKIAHKCTYTLEANWKLAIENFMECYHCFANHPEMCSQFIHPNVSATDSIEGIKKYQSIWSQWCESTAKIGHPIGGVEDIDMDAEQFNVIFRTVINKDKASYGKDEAPLAPLMGQFSQYDNGETFGFCGALTHFSMPTDHAFIFRVNPVAIDRCQLELLWLVEQEAEENRDYCVEDLIWLWNTTIQQDIVAIERAAKGSKSKFYQPGQYTKLEQNTARFTSWYRENIASY